jgi:sterol 3beta-glucosyltransferase
MKIAVTTIGSEGDVRPYVALAKGLAGAGHDAYLVAARRYARRAADAGVRFCESGQPWNEDEYRDVMRSVLAERSLLKQGRILMSAAQRELMAALPGVMEATRDADLIVHHATDVTGFAASLAHGKPRFTGTLITDFLPGTAAAAFMRFGARFMDGVFNPVLKAAGLSPQRAIALRLNESRLLNLVAVSPLVVKPRPSWEGRWLLTGYWFLDEPDFRADPDLAAFMAESPAPVIIAFGSMPAQSPAELTELIVDAVTRAGARAVLQAGMALLGAKPGLPRRIHVVRYVPYDWLLARCSAIVHHGGAGTCAAALRAGVPQAVVWHLGDQKTWGRVMFRCGVAAPPIFHRKLSVEWLESTIRRLRSDDEIRAASLALGAELAKERGIEKAVNAINASIAAM